MPVVVPNSFFKERRSFEEIKFELISRYLADWCGTQSTTREEGEEEAILYIDLHAGTSLTTDGHPAIPHKLLENLCQSINSKQHLNGLIRSYFSDVNKTVAERLQEMLAQLPGCSQLVHAPVSLGDPVNQAMLSELLALDYPAFAFLNPFIPGHTYELMLQLWSAVSTDLLLLFSPESILKALTGKKIHPALATLFGDRMGLITNFCKKDKNNGRRQEFILEQFQCLLQERGYTLLFFKINQPDTDEVSHYLLFCTKSDAAYNIYKELMLTYSDYQADGVPMFVANHTPKPQLSLFPQRLTYSVENLAEDLATQAARYKYKSVDKVSEDHSIGTPYIRENYLAAFELLRDQGKVEMLNAKTLQAIRKPTFASIIKYK